MNTPGLNAGLAPTQVDEWVRAGVREAVVSPGSRSAPLAMAIAADGRLRLSVILDERSASFFALGAAKESGRAVVVVCTSGTAAANLHPAVMEAWHSRTPLLVCTADRPPELRDTGAGQTVDQLKLFGGAVRWFAEAGVPEDIGEAGRYWRSLASRAWWASMGPPAGPVHLNLAFREPLVPEAPDGDASSVDLPGGRAAGRPWTESQPGWPPPVPEAVSALSAAVEGATRGVLLAGWGAGLSPAAADRFARAAGWPVLADAVSGVRCGVNAVSAYDPLLRSEDFARRMRPDLVVQVGAWPTNRTVGRWLGDPEGPGGPERSGRLEGPAGLAGPEGSAGPPEVRRILVDPDGAWLDPHRSATARIAADPDTLLLAVAEHVCWQPQRNAWLEAWTEAESQARGAVDTLLDSWADPFEGRVVRDVAACLPAGSTVVVGSSMPVRDAESFVAARDGLRWVSNRGAAGIDGFVSTVLGASRTAAGPVVGVLGDLTLLHDAGGLLGTAGRGLDAVLVVLDNDGGGVFSFLPQARHPEHFETLFGTPHRLDLLEVAAAYGVAGQRVTSSAEVVPAVQSALAAGGVQLVVVPSDRAVNVTRHRQVWDAVASAMGGKPSSG